MAHQDEYYSAGKNIAAVGGWHDAGDYGKYVTTTAVTIARLVDAELANKYLQAAELA